MAKKGAKSAAAPAPAMKSASVAAKPTSKSTKGKAPVPVVEPESEEDDEELDEEDWSDEDMEDSEDDAEDEDDEDDETGGVTESAMRKLMKALGDDGLDDIARAQLGEAEADDEEEEDDEEEGEGSDGEGSEEDEEMDSDVGEEETSTLTNAQLLGLEPADDEDEVDADGMLDRHELGSDVSVDEDAVPVRKVTVVRRPALKQLKERLMVSNQPFDQTLVLVGGSVDDFADVDVGDDLKREVAFYKQALSVVGRARKLAAKHDVPFTRPRDYYAEMVKTDSHMERVRSRLVDEASSIKKSEQAKRQRELKKYGKQIQQEKLKQRADDRKSFEERVKGIKRKRAGGAEIGGGDGDDFGVELDDVMEGRSGGGGRGGRGGRGDKTKMPRQARDAKYGMGGKGRRSKQNDRESTNDFGGAAKRGGFGGGRGGGRGGKTQRPGKSRRSKGRA